MDIDWTNKLFVKIFNEDGKDIGGITEILNGHAKDIDINRRYHTEKKTIIMICARFNNKNAGLLLLEYIENGKLIYQPSCDSDGHSDLWYAIKYNSNEMAKKMISTSFFTKDETIGHILAYCIEEKNMEIYNYILQEKLPIDFFSIIPIYKKTLLMIMLSTKSESENKIDELIDTFKNKESRVDKDGNDALWYAVNFNKKIILTRMINDSFFAENTSIITVLLYCSDIQNDIMYMYILENWKSECQFEIKKKQNEISEIENQKKISPLTINIQYILHDVIDLILKNVLQKSEKYEYYVAGYKALERLVYFSGISSNINQMIYKIIINRDTISFLKYIFTNINEYINYQYKPIIKFIYNLLLKNDLVDSDCLENYSGEKNIILLKGETIFLKLQLKKELLIKNNEIELPICTIYNSIYTDPLKYKHVEVNNIKYASIIDVMSMIKNDEEIINILLNEKNILCINEFGIPSTENNFVIEKNNLSTSIDINIKKIFDNFCDLYLKKIKNGDFDLFFGYHGDKFKFNYDNIKKNIENKKLKELNHKVCNILGICDKEYGNPLLTYTNHFHKYINLYCQLTYFDIKNIENNKQILELFDYMKNKNHNSVYNKAKSDAINLRNLFYDIHNDTYYGDLYKEVIDTLFNDYITVISSQTFTYYDKCGKIDDNISNMQEIGSIIFLPNFLSTIFEFNKDFGQFVSYTKVIYKIKIQKQSKRWIYVNKYSKMPKEKEILIISNSKYKITDIYHKPVQTRLAQYNVKVISLELMEDTIQNGGGFNYIALTDVDYDMKNLNKLNNMLLNSDKFDKTIENIKYLNLLDNAINEQRINKIINVDFTNNAYNSNKSPKSLPISNKDVISRYKPSPSPSPSLQQVNSSGGGVAGDYHSKYLKYKKKYLNKKKMPSVFNSSGGGVAGDYHSKYLKYKKKYLNKKKMLSVFNTNIPGI
jgi:hypothetical protein